MGSLTNAFLSHPFWTPFARLTYGAYLCHPLVVKLSAACAVQYYTFSGMDLLYRMSGNVILAYFASFLQWCVIERPMMTFTTAMIKSRKKQPKTEPEADARPANEAEPNAEAEVRPAGGK